MPLTNETLLQKTHLYNCPNASFLVGLFGLQWIFGVPIGVSYYFAVKLLENRTGMERSTIVAMIVLFHMTIVLAFVFYNHKRNVANNRNFQLGSNEWLEWLERAQTAEKSETLPILKVGSVLNDCLSAYIPQQGNLSQYSFQTILLASQFCKLHCQIAVDILRRSCDRSNKNRSLAIGLRETREGMNLLLFRQTQTDCAVFFNVAYHTHGTIVHLTTNQWAVFNRDAKRQEGRIQSDEQIAEKNLPSGHFRIKPEWGVLGTWHLVNWICQYKGYPNSYAPPSDGVLSELEYYDKVIQTEAAVVAYARVSSGTTTGSGIDNEKHSATDNRKSGEFL
jgi:hypothetical protein